MHVFGKVAYFKGPIHAQAVFRPSERRWPGGRLNRPQGRSQSIEFCQKAALSLAETPWSEDMALTLARDKLKLLSAAAVAATVITKEKSMD